MLVSGQVRHLLILFPLMPLSHLKPLSAGLDLTPTWSGIESKYPLRFCCANHVHISFKFAANLNPITEILLNQVDCRFLESCCRLGKQKCFVSRDVCFKPQNVCFSHISRTSVRGISSVGASNGNSACCSGETTFVNRRLTIDIVVLLVTISPRHSPICLDKP